MQWVGRRVGSCGCVKQSLGLTAVTTGCGYVEIGLNGKRHRPGAKHDLDLTGDRVIPWAGLSDIAVRKRGRLWTLVSMSGKYGLGNVLVVGDLFRKSIQ